MSKLNRGLKHIAAASIILTGLLSQTVLGDSRVDKVVEALKTKITAMAKKDEFSGTVMVKYKGEVVYQDALGWANRSYDIPLNMDTKLNLGSMNKMFTAVAIMQLVEQGKISLDDTVGKFLPDFPNETIRNKATVAHLLSHRAGTGMTWGQTYMNKMGRLRKVDDFMEIIEAEELRFEPGSKMGYSNSGFILLGKIIEIVTGTDYFTYVRDNIFTPLGMNNTDSYETDLVVKNLGMGYSRLDPTSDEMPKDKSAPLRDYTYMHAPKGTPGGGGFSTAVDLQKFAEGLLSYKVLSKKSLDVMWETHSLMKGRGGRIMGWYGYGFGGRGEDMNKTTSKVGHNGGGPMGIGSMLYIYPKLDLTISLMTNLSGSFRPTSMIWERTIMKEFGKSAD